MEFVTKNKRTQRKEIDTPEDKELWENGVILEVLG